MSETAAELKEKLAREEAEFKQLQDYYESLFATYGTRGWKALMEDVTRMHETHNNLDSIDTQEQLWFRKGQLSQMVWLLMHQDTVERAFSALIAEREDKPEEAPTGGVAKIVSGTERAE